MIFHIECCRHHHHHHHGLCRIAPQSRGSLGVAWRALHLDKCCDHKTGAWKWRNIANRISCFQNIDLWFVNKMWCSAVYLRNCVRLTAVSLCRDRVVLFQKKKIVYLHCPGMILIIRRRFLWGFDIYTQFYIYFISFYFFVIICFLIHWLNMFGERRNIFFWLLQLLKSITIFK